MKNSRGKLSQNDTRILDSLFEERDRRLCIFILWWEPYWITIIFILWSRRPVFPVSSFFYVLLAMVHGAYITIARQFFILCIEISSWASLTDPLSPCSTTVWAISSNLSRRRLLPHPWSSSLLRPSPRLSPIRHSEEPGLRDRRSASCRSWTSNSNSKRPRRSWAAIPCRPRRTCSVRMWTWSIHRPICLCTHNRRHRLFRWNRPILTCTLVRTTILWLHRAMSKMPLCFRYQKELLCRALSRLMRRPCRLLQAGAIPPLLPFVTCNRTCYLILPGLEALHLHVLLHQQCCPRDELHWSQISHVPFFINKFCYLVISPMTLSIMTNCLKILSSALLTDTKFLLSTRRVRFDTYFFSWLAYTRDFLLVVKCLCFDWKRVWCCGDSIVIFLMESLFLWQVR